MLERVTENTTGKFMDFNSIKRFDSGSGLCYVYNVVLKATKAGKPFITLYLRDAAGNTIPGYVFDLASPLLAGGEAKEVTGKIVNIDWQENYLSGVGLTLILDKVQIITDASTADYALFQGAIQDLQKKKQDVVSYLSKQVGVNMTLPVSVDTYASPEFAGGRQGGLLEHFWKMSLMLNDLQGLSTEERRRVTGIFALYILAYSNYLAACDRGDDSIVLASALTKRVSSLAETLRLGPAALEVVHMFFGYQPKDIYVRTVSTVSDSIHKIEKEFTLYHTIPLEQEGDAGYGKIRRYVVEGR